MLRWFAILAVAWLSSPMGTAIGQVYTASATPSAGCNTCGYVETYCECGPTWRPYATAELLWLDRTQGAPNPFVIDQPDLLVLNFVNEGDVSDLLYNAEAGVRGTLGVEHANGNAIEVRYFGVYDQAANYISNGTNLFSVMFLDASTNLGVTRMTTEMRSDFHSGELNWALRRWGRLRPIVGARWFRLSEEWDVFETALPTTGTSAEIDNDMVGGQLGLDVCLWERSGWLRVDARLLGSVLHNNVDLAANRHTAAAVINSFTAQDSRVAYTGQIDLTARWQPTRHFAVIAGYTGLWMENVALVADQVDDFTLATGAGAFDIGNVSYQGGHFGVEVIW